MNSQLPDGAIVRAGTRLGGHGENFRKLEYEIDERMAVLQEENPDMNWVHARNKAKKEVTDRRIHSLAEKQGNTKFMKAVSIKQPWAWAIAYGFKTIETRTQPTKHRGEILIVSSKKADKAMLECLKKDLNLDFGDQLEYGKAIAVANIIDCRPMTEADQDPALCDIYEGAYSWVLDNVRKIESFDVTGQLGIYNVDISEHRESL